MNRIFFSGLYACGFFSTLFLWYSFIKVFMKTLQSMVTFQAKTGAIELKTDLKAETLWATQAQMAALFGVQPAAITKHLKNIYAEKELLEKATCSKMEQVQIEGKRHITRSVQVYNLDVMISVGYRINSKLGTKFRQWATKTLRQHIVEGYTLNKKRIAKNYDAFLEAVEKVKRVLPAGSMDTESVLELVKTFASAWFSLDAYDRSLFPERGLTKKQVKFTAHELGQALATFKEELLLKKEATTFFGQERSLGAVEGIVGNVLQSFGGQEAYESVEEKAAHLLYFIVKNHPFVDGNKRNGAFAFVWFLRHTKLLNTQRITPEALTALTLLIASSKPTDKDQMVGLVLLLLKS